MDHTIYIYSLKGELIDIKSLILEENENIKSLLYNFSPNKVYKKVGKSFYNYINQMELQEIKDNDYPQQIIIQSKY